MSHSEQRACPVCSRSFTWSSKRPAHRFCDPRCKAIWAREIKKAREHGLPPPAPGDPRLRPGHTAAPREDPPREGPPHGALSPAILSTAPMAISRETCCPHCRQLVAVVAVLIPPAAVYVDTPSQSVTNIN